MSDATEWRRRLWSELRPLVLAAVVDGKTDELIQYLEELAEEGG